jgi:osmotically-inducible protein OsmY
MSDMVSRFLASLMVLLLVVPMVVAQPKSNDDRIDFDVRRKLADDVDVRGAGLEVIVKDGMVTLKGRVRTEKAKDKATRIAKKVKGVVGVNNQLVVSTAS